MNDTSEYRAAADRYDSMEYRRSGRSGLKLPAVSLGLWHNFGDDRALDSQRAILRRAFDLGVTHFDLANNYGPPPGSAELNFGKLFAQDFAPYRDELVISTKAGYLMNPGPYGEWGSRKYLLSSLDASLSRMGLDYVDIFYSHRFDPDTPLEETMGALASAVQQGKALYVGVSSYNSEQTAKAARLLTEMGVRPLIHQPSYSMINRWTEDDGLLDTLETAGMGCISFVPLAQGLLTNKYLKGIPEGSRATQGKSLDPGLLNDEVVRRPVLGRVVPDGEVHGDAEPEERDRAGPGAAALHRAVEGADLLVRVAARRRQEEDPRLVHQRVQTLGAQAAGQLRVGLLQLRGAGAHRLLQPRVVAAELALGRLRLRLERPVRNEGSDRHDRRGPGAQRRHRRLRRLRPELDAPLLGAG